MLQVWHRQRSDAVNLNKSQTCHVRCSLTAAPSTWSPTQRVRVSHHRSIDCSLPDHSSWPMPRIAVAASQSVHRLQERSGMPQPKRLAPTVHQGDRPTLVAAQHPDRKRQSILRLSSHSAQQAAWSKADRSNNKIHHLLAD